MGEVVSLEERQRRKSVDALVNSIGGMYDSAGEFAEEFLDLAMNDPMQAVEQLPRFIAKARSINPPGIEAMAGGPNHDWVAPMFNVLGAVYPFLPPDAREKGLRKCIDYLDGLNYFYSQNHVELIDEPLLVADIKINRYLYWPGYKHATALLEKYRGWDEFKEHMGEVRSEFFRTYPILKPKYASLNVRTGFAKEFPDLLERLLGAAAALTWDKAESIAKQDGKPYDSLLTEYMNDFDPLLHGMIHAKIGERNWIVLPSRK
jgi:hypothetical protein